MTRSLNKIVENKVKVRRKAAITHYGTFSRMLNTELCFKEFHIIYYKILNLFANGFIKKLIITMAPQHGKSEGSTRLLIPYLLGINPDLKIAIGSYAASKAQKFNREIQRYMDTITYKILFPETNLNSTSIVTVAGAWLRNSHEFEIVGRKGGLKAVGRQGGITGDPVDVWVLDDVYKDLKEGNSPVVRDAAWEWFDGSVQTRTHNETRELIVFTRWHEDDIIGRLEKGGEVIEVNSWEDIKNADKEKYIKINFEAIKESEKTEFDSREANEELWPEKHSLKLLNKKKARDPLHFNCLYQGKPDSKEGLLYGEFREYETMPRIVIGKGNCTDTADQGDDYLASVNYSKVKYKFPDDEKERVYLFVTDLIFSQESMEKTEPQVALMLDRDGIGTAYIESNNGGKGFARKVKEYISGHTKVIWYHQSKNKESRILTNATTVTDRVVFPVGWKNKHPEAYRYLNTYKKLFKANKYDDLPDVLTAMIEKEIILQKGSGVKRAN